MTRLALLIGHLATALLPREVRPRHREQWEADIRGAAEIGLSPLRIATGAAVAAVQLAVTTRRQLAVAGSGTVGRLRAASTPSARRRVAIVQLILAALYVQVLLLYAISRMRLGIGHNELIQDGNDPKDLLPFGSSPLNPFFWLYALSQIYVLLQGWYAGAALAVWSAIHAFTGAGRSRRWSAAAAAISVVVVAIAVGRFGSDIFRWVLD